MVRSLAALLLSTVCTGLSGQDTCQTAVPITLPGLYTGNTNQVGSSGIPWSCVPFGVSPDWWYSFTPTCSGQATASFCAAGAQASFNPVIAVYDGTCGTPIEIACVDSTCGLLPEVTWTATVGTTYWIRIADALFSVGSFTLSFAYDPGITLVIDQPGGPGSLRLANSCGNPGDIVFIAVSFDPANATGLGQGWWAGLHIGIFDVLTEWTLGFPFRSNLDSQGEFVVSFPSPTIPPNFPPLYAVTSTFTPGGQHTGDSNPVGITLQ
jgi:hypothetical protein